MTHGYVYKWNVGTCMTHGYVYKWNVGTCVTHGYVYKWNVGACMTHGVCLQVERRDMHDINVSVYIRMSIFRDDVSSNVSSHVS